MTKIAALTRGGCLILAVARLVVSFVIVQAAGRCLAQGQVIGPQGGPVSGAKVYLKDVKKLTIKSYEDDQQL